MLYRTFTINMARRRFNDKKKKEKKIESYKHFCKINADFFIFNNLKKQITVRRRDSKRVIYQVL